MVFVLLVRAPIWGRYEALSYNLGPHQTIFSSNNVTLPYSTYHLSLFEQSLLVALVTTLFSFPSLPASSAVHQIEQLNYQSQPNNDRV